MNRLQKKCFIASAGFHLMLAVILLVGPAFLSRDEKTDEIQTIEFIPMITTDANASGGGNPKGAQPPPQPQPTPPAPKPAVPPPAPEPQPPVKTQPEKESKPEPDQTQPDPDSLEPVKTRKRTIEVNTKLVVRNTDSQQARKARAEAEARRIAERNQRLAAALGGAVSSLQRNLSGSTTIELKGPGGGGLPYANWLSAVKQVYTEAWLLPDGVTDDSATVTASVTIARNGEVISTSILRFSGSSLVDQSVRATLDRVRYAPALPDGAKEDRRTVTINFNVKAKLLG